MSEECTKSDCESCGESGCGHRKGAPAKEAANAGSRVKHMIAVISGKGGVGKSTVTALLANAVKQMGKNSAILDADITGPSIPKMYGITEKAGSNGEAVLPVKSKGGMPVMSINVLLEDENEPVIWRGPVISGTVRQFWTEVAWGDVDVMLVDMPPGTGDVPLTVFQSLPVDGIVVVTSPQDLVSMIVGKAVRMAQMMNVPVLGLVENLSYFECPDCGKRHEIFGPSHIEEVAGQYGIEQIVRLPINPEQAAICDNGEADQLSNEELAAFAGRIVTALEEK
ncbi:MAG: Mrp/NBP35 family ATP-binding protein [Lachnospiraceae bacterium]|nr:Mrp/NBP35 family ATP-binding protein [Lachnospiraceae bacterium]MBR6156731.1 Mrp/NBP35 family ATP-binding protein [Lachnospiraceae bacterium]MBR6850558.1 Mrp/NBP35 family ATP-binding protein [Lachnospiraceae bacterium]